MAHSSEFFESLAAIVEDEQLQGADRLGERVAKRLGHDWGGLRVYISQDRAYRDQEIYAAFSGDNYDALARKYRLTERNVRRIVARERERRRPKQFSLLPL